MLLELLGWFEVIVSVLQPAAPTVLLLVNEFSQMNDKQ